MSQIATNELWQIFDARRVKAPELKGLDAMANGVSGWFQNRRRVLPRLRAQVDRVEKLEPRWQPVKERRLPQPLPPACGPGPGVRFTSSPSTITSCSATRRKWARSIGCWA